MLHGALCYILGYRRFSLILRLGYMSVDLVTEAKTSKVCVC